ncbi:MAG TPA: uracil-DNA glycosylase [Dehalococcoidia bacterium]|jgi:uracil-DNA glycosylase family 4|nr:uracil-DNA glycosylase [Dehalococcoidia bacterium]
MAHCHTLGSTNGPANAAVMFVGEAPGRFGAGRSGVPFSGDEAGRRFESLLRVAGLARDEVFITNAVLCNPLDEAGRNRRPKASEVRRCSSFLGRQIETVDPRFVVALGGVALDAIARIEAHNLSLRGDCVAPVAWFERTLIAVYHPGRRALVHRNETQQLEDWRRLGELVSGSAPPRRLPA